MSELAVKRIPVTEKTWKELAELKEAGESYNDVLEELIKEYKEYRLARRVEAKLKRNKFTKVTPGKW